MTATRLKLNVITFMIIIMVIIIFFIINIIILMLLPIFHYSYRDNYCYYFQIYFYQNNGKSWQELSLLRIRVFLLINKLSSNLKTNWLGSPLNMLKSSQITWWSQTPVWSLTDAQKVASTGFLALNETPW